MSLINEHIELHDKEMNEAFESIKAFLNSNKFTNKEIKKANLVLKNITKQIWSKFYLYKKAKQKKQKDQGLDMMVYNRDFIQGFFKSMDADPSIKDAVMHDMSNKLNMMDRMYRGYKKGIVDSTEVKKRFKHMMKKRPDQIITEFVNTIAFETTVFYLNKQSNFTEIDIKPENKSKVIKSMSGATGGIVQGVSQSITDRANRK